MMPAPNIRWTFYRITGFVLLLAICFSELRLIALALFVVVLLLVAFLEPVDRKGRQVRFGFVIKESSSDDKQPRNP